MKWFEGAPATWFSGKVSGFHLVVEGTKLFMVAGAHIMKEPIHFLPGERRIDCIVAMVNRTSNYDMPH